VVIIGHKYTLLALSAASELSGTTNHCRRIPRRLAASEKISTASPVGRPSLPVKCTGGEFSKPILYVRSATFGCHANIPPRTAARARTRLSVTTRLADSGWAKLMEGAARRHPQ